MSGSTAQRVSDSFEDITPAQDRFDKAPNNAHLDIDSKDERSIANRLSAAQKHDAEDNETAKTITDPLAPARSHGNEPSRGAKIDAQLQREDEELLKKKKD